MPGTLAHKGLEAYALSNDWAAAWAVIGIVRTLPEQEALPGGGHAAPADPDGTGEIRVVAGAGHSPAGRVLVFP